MFRSLPEFQLSLYAALDAARAEIEKRDEWMGKHRLALNAATAQLTAVRAERDEAMERINNLQIGNHKATTVEIHKRIAELKAQVAEQQARLEELEPFDADKLSTALTEFNEAAHDTIRARALKEG